MTKTMRKKTQISRQDRPNQQYLFMILQIFADTSLSQCSSRWTKTMFYNTRFVVFLGLGLLTSLSLSCSEADEKSRKKSKSDDADAELPSTKPEKDTAEKEEAQAEGDEAEGEDDESESEGDPEAKIKALLADCGASSIDNKNPDKVIYEKELKGLPVSKNLIVVNVTIESTLKIKVTGKETTQDSLVTVKEISGPLQGLAKKMAEKQAADNSGLATLTNVPFDQYSGLSKHSSWEGVVCTFVPVTKIVNERGGHETTVTFETPLPSSLSPKASASRYESEIGKSRIFDDIKATIEESDHPALKGKKSVTGTVTVKKVESEIEVDDGEGGKKEIEADLAYEITYDFGSPEITYALGLAPKVTYFVSHKKKDLVANIVDTTTVSGAVATFIHE